jgi:nitroimidazol reductase NimA-like FMN-containing flavoprotein (pyridoxamine 5'-phosphate oxidase superfamily)
MSSWSEVRAAAPELADAVQGRFEAHGLALLATLRRDGSPRISAIELLFANGELWLGMMPESRKAQDLERDPRLALHSATIDKDVKEGDAKLFGRGLLVRDDDTWQRYLAALKEQAGYAPDGWFPVFRVDVAEVSFLRPAGDHLDIQWWREGEPVHRIERR